ncbi:MAG: ABC transporter ATP-binding protein [Myxococcales bacterium]|nr:ABC transporter ATP-binding protein [Myxococcales bacterium]
MTAVLKAASVETLYFDRIRALCGVSLEVSAGEIFGVLGPNGAGKTTLLRTIAGFLQDQPEKGTIELSGRRIERRKPEEIARLGVVYVPEDRGLFRELTVSENLEAALWGRRGQPDEIYEMFPILRERRDQQAETLSGGEQQMLAIGRALLRKPRLLLLDEPSLGLAPSVADGVFAALQQIARGGTAIVLVEQNARIALRIAHRAAILESGRIVLQGTAEELQEHPDVREAYLGIVAALPQKDFRLHRRRRRW